MVIGILQAELYIPGNQSLKEKRMILKTLKDRIRDGFNVSVSELGDHDKWQKAVLGIVTIGTEKRKVDEVLANLISFIQREKRVELLNYSVELL